MPAENQPSLLVVEDQSLIRSLYRAALADKYNLILTARGREGYEAFISNPKIPLALLDQKLPDMQGEDLAQMLRDISKDPLRPQILMVTASHDFMRQDRAMEKGVNAFLPKPFSIRELSKALDVRRTFLDSLRTPRA